MSKLCNLLGIKTKKMIVFPEMFRIQNNDLMSGLVQLHVFNEYRPEYCTKPYQSNEKAVERSLWKLNSRVYYVTICRYDELIERLKKLQEESRKRNGRLSIELRFMMSDCNIVFYRGKVNLKLIKEFEEFKNKEEK